MPDQKPYRIDEIALRDKLTNYRVDFNIDSINILENEVAQIKTHQPIELPETKKIVWFIGIPVTLAILGCAAYFGFNYIKSIPPAVAKKDTVTVLKPTVENKVEVKPQQINPPVNTTSITAHIEVKKQDTITETTAQPLKIKEKKSPAEQVKVVKKDTAQVSKVQKTKLDSIEKRSKADTSSVSKNKDIQPKKKKKKRKNILDATDDIRKSQPNSADDDVVIPDNR